MIVQYAQGRQYLSRSLSPNALKCSPKKLLLSASLAELVPFLSRYGKKPAAGCGYDSALEGGGPEGLFGITREMRGPV